MSRVIVREFVSLDGIMGDPLLGRRTWQQFAGIWPARDDPFSAKMNASPKLAAARLRPAREPVTP